MQHEVHGARERSGAAQRVKAAGERVTHCWCEANYRRHQPHSQLQLQGRLRACAASGRQPVRPQHLQGHHLQLPLRPQVHHQLHRQHPLKHRLQPQQRRTAHSQRWWLGGHRGRQAQAHRRQAPDRHWQHWASPAACWAETRPVQAAQGRLRPQRGGSLHCRHCRCRHCSPQCRYQRYQDRR